ncbi:MAG: Ig-like domain-containing protein [bacterium]|nr:Ig-like domain-containing protein [bacterium]
MKYIKKTEWVSKLALMLLMGVLLAPTSSLASYTWTLNEISTTANQFIYNESDDDGSNLIVAFPTLNTGTDEDNIFVGGRIFTSSDSGTSWTERQPAGATTENWRAIATDADGSNLIAGVMNGRLYTSSNSGTSWAERKPAGDFDYPWQSVASDADGSTLVATVHYRDVYISTNSGKNWTTRQPGGASADWILSAVSNDGSFIIVGAYDGRMYTSSNSGTSWTERQPAGNIIESWQSVAMNSDGSTIVVGVDGGRLYSSSDFGATWTESQPLGSTDQDWQDLAISDDGSYVVAAVYGGRVYVSDDSGSTWSEVQPAGDTTQYWISVSVDSDASHIFMTKNQVFSGLPTVHVYTGMIDTFAPVILSSFPADNSSDATPNANLIMTFDEAVTAKAGKIVIKKSGGKIVESIDVSSEQVTGSGTNTITINPISDLDFGTAYYVNIDAAAFSDLLGNSYTGISNKKNWSFKTEAAPRGSGGNKH